VLYRPYTPEDFTALYAIEEICFQPPLSFSRRYMRQLVNSPHAATWIAEEDGRMAGFAIVQWAEEAGRVIAYIQTIEVAPEQLRHGIGNELLCRIEGSALSAGAQAIWLHVDAANAAAIRLYETNGYRSEGREENYYSRGRAALIYLKRLASESVN
jgi:ribosomal protein S18 acetylase RimI-like enzyme